MAASSSAWFAPDQLADVPIVGLVALSLGLPMPTDEFEAVTAAGA